MKDRYQVIVIGGGIVGVSVGYHLTLRGLTDVAILERNELTAGSTWHAAGGFHTINADTRVAALMKYTIDLYPRVERESGQGVGLHMSGGIELAGTPERWRWLKSELAWVRTQGVDARIITPQEAAEMVPILDPSGLYGALWDPDEGNLDPNGATRAYAIAARQRGADVIEHNRVLALRRTVAGEWRIETEQGVITAEHVVNAGGMWARRVGRMVGIDHPIAVLLHQYLVTQEVPEVAAIGGDMPAVTDLEGFTYLQKEGTGVLLGVYETNPRHWTMEGAPWEYGMTLFPEEVDRILPELTIGFERFPVLRDIGIRRWVHGGIAFTPDGNPLVGPVAGVPNYWCACGCMAGFSQCGGIGLAVANWIADGDPGVDVFGMDVARFGSYASNDRYLRDTTKQFYARRFVMAYPNEELPAGRPLKTTPCYDEFLSSGARFTVNWGLEVPLYFARSADFEEADTLGRSNAEPIVADEVRAVRTAAGAYEIAQYARYEVTGSAAKAWLDRLLSSRIPEPGRIRLSPMLNERGRLMGDLSVSGLDDDRFWLTGSYYLQDWHMRWFLANVERSGIAVRNITDDWMGFSLSGPASRRILEALTGANVSSDGLPFLGIREIDVGSASAIVGRISLTGELGYEIVVPPTLHRTLLNELCEAGAAHGLRLIGDRAVDSLRLEKAYGIWSAEFRQDRTPGESGLDRYVAFDKGEFVGRDAVVRERETGPDRRLVLLDVEADDADASTDEGIWQGERRVGFVTSGAYGHTVGKSLALAYLDRHVIDGGDDVAVYVVGDARVARILPEPPYDPAGRRLRDNSGTRPEATQTLASS